MRHEELRKNFLNDLKYLFNIDGVETKKEKQPKVKSLKPVKEYYLYKRKKRDTCKNIMNIAFFTNF